MSANQLYYPIQQALEKKAEEEIMKLLHANSQEHQKTNIKIRVSIEADGLQNKSSDMTIFGCPRLDTAKSHLLFQNSLSDEMARMLQHAS
jgi:hypothetical protein